MTDPLRSPSEHLGEWASGHLRTAPRLGALHPITVVLILAGVLSLLGSLADVAGRVGQITQELKEGLAPPIPIGDLAALALSRTASSLSYIGTAATVEYLFRIWEELKALRTTKRTTAPPPSEL